MVGMSVCVCVCVCVCVRARAPIPKVRLRKPTDLFAVATTASVCWLNLALCYSVTPSFLVKEMFSSTWLWSLDWYLLVIGLQLSGHSTWDESACPLF